LVVITPWLPKLSVEALLITHDELTVIRTVKVDVVVAALAESIAGRMSSAAADIVSAHLGTGQNVVDKSSSQAIVCRIRREG